MQNNEAREVLETLRGLLTNQRKDRFVAESNATPWRNGKRTPIDLARLSALVDEGHEARDIAAALHVANQTVQRWVNQLGIRHKLKSSKIPQGLDWARVHGVPMEIYTICRANGAILAYQRQKDTAKQRGIEWRFTFASWWRMWEESGKWEMRGRTKGMGGWEMSRPGDVGPYSPDNVVIVTHRENMAQVQATLAARRATQPRKHRTEERRVDPRYKLKNDPSKVELAIQLYRQGRSLTAIGNAIGVHRSAARAALVRCGVFEFSNKNVA